MTEGETHLSASIQLWPARKLELPAALTLIASLGYDSVQPYSSLFRDDCRSFRQRVDAHGLSMPSVHMELADLQRDFHRWVDMAATLGAGLITIPHVGPTDVMHEKDDWHRLGAALAEVASRLQPEGLRLAWANHDREFRPFADGSRPIDLLLTYENVDYELVLGWLTVVGQDVVRELDRYGDRIRILRLRDWDGAAWTAIGDGKVGYEGLGPVIRGLPVLKQLVVDDDLPSDFASFARRSLAGVRKSLPGVIGK